MYHWLLVLAYDVGRVVVIVVLAQLVTLAGPVTVTGRVMLNTALLVSMAVGKLTLVKRTNAWSVTFNGICQV